MELPAVQARHEVWCRAVLSDLAATPPDEAWCVRFDRVVDDARAALLRCAADPARGVQAADLAAQLADLLWLRGRPTEAQRRYEQAAALCPSPADRAQHLRMAAGAADGRYVGLEVLRLLRAAADAALSYGDRGAAARDLAWMSNVITRAPGTLAEKRTHEEAAALLAEARAVVDGSARAEAAIALATCYFEWPAVGVDDVERAASLAQEADDGAMESSALDLLTAVHLNEADLPGAVQAVHRRDAVIGSLAMVAANGFEHRDHHGYAAEVLLAAGDLRGAAEFADRMARLAFNRGEDHLGVARRIVVNAIVGQFDVVLRDSERFRRAWERAGQPVIPTLSRCAYAAAMVHGMLGHDAARAEWAELTHRLGTDVGRLASCDTGWAPTFDGLTALHRGDFGAAVDRLAVSVEEANLWQDFGGHMWPTRYAAVWAEAAVLAGRDDALARIDRARPVARDNPVAAALVERAAAVAADDRDAVHNLEATFATLGCPYQQERTSVLATRLP